MWGVLDAACGVGGWETAVAAWPLDSPPPAASPLDRGLPPSLGGGSVQSAPNISHETCHLVWTTQARQ